jgi:hypothetical protein
MIAGVPNGHEGRTIMPDTIPTTAFKQASAGPTSKVMSGGLAGAMCALIVWALNDFNVLPGGAQIPGEIASALTTVMSFAVAYVIPPSGADQIAPA